MVEIAGVEFVPTDSEVDWISVDGRFILTLVMETPKCPWRLTTNGHQHKSRFSTPHVAVIRARQSTTRTGAPRVAA